MMNFNELREMALSYPETEELPHFDIPSFRYKKKIFATYHPKENRAMLKLSIIDQSVFCDMAPSIFYPAQGSWGKQGATYVDLNTVNKDMFADALNLAYEGISTNKKK